MSDDGKIAWRRMTKELFRLVPPDARRGLDATLAERVREVVFRRGARFLLGFSPLPDEPDLSAFFGRWVAEGGLLALPAWLGGERMALRKVDDFERRLVPGRGGILEPSVDSPEVDPAELDLAVTPGRAFSESGMRLGRGAGCYDALFRDHPRLMKVGVAYDFQVFPEVPADGGDVPVDAVITPSRIVGETWTV